MADACAVIISSLYSHICLISVSNNTCAVSPCIVPEALPGVCLASTSTLPGSRQGKLWLTLTFSPLVLQLLGSVS